MEISSGERQRQQVSTVSNAELKMTDLYDFRAILFSLERLIKQLQKAIRRTYAFGVRRLG